jgi:splicing factor U2AF subunit
MSAYAPQSHYPPNLLRSPQVGAQDKIHRELFVGNTPPGTTELLLLNFLNAAMRRVHLCGPLESPILNCRLSQKFAFVELATAEAANQAMQMNSIPFLGAILKISRPSKYTGPLSMQSRTWQDLTGQALPTGAALDGDLEKMSRELFIGNTTPEMTEVVLRDFLGNAMQQVGLTTMPGSPIHSCRVSGKFAFVELRTAQETTNALNLNNIPFMGAALRVGRPSKWNGPPDHQGNWEDILAKFMAGEIAPTGAAVAPAAPASRVVVLEQMLTADDLANPDEYQDIMEDTRDECAQFGQLQQVVIPRANEPGATKIFLEYATSDDAAAAIAALQGRTFDSRQVSARYFDPELFAAKQYDA